MLAAVAAASLSCHTKPHRSGVPTVPELLEQPIDQALETLRANEQLAPALVEALGEESLAPSAANLLRAWWPRSLHYLGRAAAEAPAPLPQTILFDVVEEKASREQRLEFLLVALKNPDDQVKVDVAFQLATTRTDAVLAALLAAYAGMRRSGLEGFAHGDDGKGLRWFFGPGGADFQVSDAIVELVGSDTDMLLRALRHEDAKVRAEAAGYLSMWWHNYPGDRDRIEAAVTQALEDPSSAVRERASRARAHMR